MWSIVGMILPRKLKYWEKDVPKCWAIHRKSHAHCYNPDYWYANSTGCANFRCHWHITSSQSVSHLAFIHSLSLCSLYHFWSVIYQKIWNFKSNLPTTQLSVSLLNSQCWSSSYLHDQSEVRLIFARFEVLTAHWFLRRLFIQKFMHM